MGFPVGYPELFLPKFFLHALYLLSFVRTLLFSFLSLLGLADLLDSAAVVSPGPAASPEHHGHRNLRVPVSAVLIRELLPVVKLGGGGDGAEESCAVCLYELDGGEEIRRLWNCRHVFHRECVDRWMDHDQMTCPLCRTPFVPEEMRDEFNQRLWAATGAPDDDLLCEYTWVSSF